jgi:hypothetical protein
VDSRWRDAVPLTVAAGSILLMEKESRSARAACEN